MATIALYANQVNQMPGLIGDIKRTVVDFQSELSGLRTGALQVNQSICDLGSVVSSIQASSQTQEEKAASLDILNQKLEQFTADAVRIDGEAADTVRQRKDDFYEQYYYLKPAYEMNGWEKFCDGCVKADAWCKEHWKLIVTVIIVIAAVILICTGVGGVLGAMAIGALMGAGTGGLIGGIISAATGGSFWEGFENGAFSGAVSGAISGGLGYALSAGGTAALTLKNVMLIGGISASGTSLAGDIGDKFIKGDDISWKQIGINAIVSGLVGVVFSGILYGVAKILTKLPWKAQTLFKLGTTEKERYGIITAYTGKSGMSFCLSNGEGRCILRIEYDSSMYWHYHCPPIFNTKSHIPLPFIIRSMASRYFADYLLNDNWQMWVIGQNKGWQNET